MKKIISIIFLSALSSYGNPTGDYLTWIGYGTCSNATGAFSSAYGAYAGWSATNLMYSTMLGVLSGERSTVMTNCNAVGYRALERAEYGNDVVAMGMNAGRNSSYCINNLWVGHGVGMNETNEVNMIRLLPGFWDMSLNEYGSPESYGVAAEHVYFFGCSLSNIILHYLNSGYITLPTKVSDIQNDTGFVTKTITNGLASVTFVTNHVETTLRQGIGVWDSTLNVYWTPKMENGCLTYYATTNVNINAAN